MSRLVYSTFVPSIESTEILLSPSRVTSAIVPSGVKVTWLVPDFSSAIVTLPTGVTVLPEIVNTDTVPSLRLATSASVPWRLIEMPAALLPASSVAMTAGGDAFRSMTDTRVSGTVLVGSLGSTLLDEPTSARLSSGGRAQDEEADDGARAARPRGGNARAPPPPGERTAADAAVPRRHADRDLRTRLLLGRREGVLAHARRLHHRGRVRRRAHAESHL